MGDDTKADADLPTKPPTLSRRHVLVSRAAGAAVPLAGACAATPAGANAGMRPGSNTGVRPERPAAKAATSGTASALPLMLHVNGSEHRLNLDPRSTLLDGLRDHIGLVGSKKGSDHGQCGACTVRIDGQRVLSCLTLAAQAQGREVTTIEGLARGDAMHPMQRAFVDTGAFHCGYCTPGRIMSAVACIAEGQARDDGEIRAHMSGNLCRCTAYPNIVAGVPDAALRPPVRQCRGRCGASRRCKRQQHHPLGRPGAVPRRRHDADIREVDVILVPEVDTETNPSGAKGIGELANVGTAAAIANAVHHATDKRIRELPITVVKLITG